MLCGSYVDKVTKSSPFPELWRLVCPQKQISDSKRHVASRGTSQQLCVFTASKGETQWEIIVLYVHYSSLSIVCVRALTQQTTGKKCSAKGSGCHQLHPQHEAGSFPISLHSTSHFITDRQPRRKQQHRPPVCGSVAGWQGRHLGRWSLVIHILSVSLRRWRVIFQGHLKLRTISCLIMVAHLSRLPSLAGLLLLVKWNQDDWRS